MRLSWQRALSLSLSLSLSHKEPRIISDDPDLPSKVLVLHAHQAWTWVLRMPIEYYID